MKKRDKIFICPFQREPSDWGITIPKIKGKLFHPCAGKSKSCYVRRFEKKVKEILEKCESVEIPQLESIWQQQFRVG